MTTSVAGVIPEWTIADKLRKAREMTGLNADLFADEIGVSRNTIGNYERGHVKPRKIVLKAWAMRTGVDYEWLTAGSGGDDPGTPQMEPPPCKRLVAGSNPAGGSVVHQLVRLANVA